MGEINQYIKNKVFDIEKDDQKFEQRGHFPWEWEAHNENNKNWWYVEN